MFVNCIGIPGSRCIDLNALTEKAGNPAPATASPAPATGSPAPATGSPAPAVESPAVAQAGGAEQVAANGTPATV